MPTPAKTRMTLTIVLVSEPHADTHGVDNFGHGMLMPETLE
jgi:hypothetical protein